MAHKQTFRQVFLQIAQSQLGVAEKPKGSNRGKEVNAYLASVGLLPGEPWCMAFVHWCAACAAKALDIPNPIYKTGHVLTFAKKTKLRTLTNKSSTVQAGDIGFMDFGGGKGHIFIVTKVHTGMVETIEGNSNDEGSREGYEVCERKRLKQSLKGFIKIPD
jgi:hypothetical protein